MIIDIIVVILLILAAIKGFSRGLIIAVFSILAFVIGLAAAIKLSSVVANYVGSAIRVSEKLLPVIAFAIVFLGVVLLVRLGAVLVQKTIHFGIFGFINRLGGMLFYALLYIFIFSVLIFYGDQLNIVSEKSKQESISYEYVRPVGPRLIEGLGKIIPVFKDMFSDLKQFFGGVAADMPAGN